MVHKRKCVLILVTTNSERLGIYDRQARLFAIEHKNHVIRWPIDFKS